MAVEDRAKTILNKVFGYKEFRPLQNEVIATVLSGRDVVVIMPTGGGKSLCYQIPALIVKGLTVVVSPLISLMKDQVQQLHQLGIPAVYLNSTLSWEDYKANMDAIRYGEAKLLYVAPETLVLDRTVSVLREVGISILAIDEAHCISEWGHDFRPEYRQIVQIKKIFPQTVTIALTATATPRVQDDIIQNLEFSNSKKFIASFDRKNLMLEVVRKNQGKRILTDFVSRFPNQSGIVYCTTRKEVEKINSHLANEGFSSLAYHAGMENEERHIAQEKFIRDDVQIIVATIAFGMGINKPNVRFVVHFNIPKNIESYYQQIGRAGRDGMGAHCLLIFGYSDIGKIQFFINQMEGLEKRIAQEHLRMMIDYAESRVCRRKPLLEYFGEEYAFEDCGSCDNCLSEPQAMVDMTIPAQKFLSCIKRTGEKYDTNHIISVLRGSKGEKIINTGHTELSTYGIGKEFSKEQWFTLARQFGNMNLYEETAQNGLVLTQSAWSVLRGKEKVHAFLPKDEKVQIKKPRGKDRFSNVEYDTALFEILRTKRKTIADESGVPPYTVFPDKSFVEMAQNFPRSKEEMMDIHGVGKHKLRKYGKTFMEIIDNYCRENNID